VSGWETLCTKQHNCGYSVDGALQEYAIAAASHVVKIPEKVSYEQAAPVLCAGVTTYKGLKESEVKPGQFITIIGAGGGLGHLAVQYGKAMGMRVIAVDVGKTAYTQSLGAEYSVDATDKDCVDKITKYTDGGSHGVLCLATSTSAFGMATNLARRKGTVVHVGLPAGTFPVPIFDVVLKRVSIRGSIVGTRTDLQEALDFAARGLIKVDVKSEPLGNINDIFTRLRDGKINGRVAIKMV
jgi:propanol-preferring alcohol dehydrogenase